MPVEIWHDSKLLLPDDRVILNTLTGTQTTVQYIIKNRTKDTVTNLSFEAPDIPHTYTVSNTVVKPDDTATITVSISGSEMWRKRRRLPDKIQNMIKYRLLYVAGGE